MTTELYKVHRPKDFSEVIGQKEVLEELKGMAKAKKFPHTLLFTGPSGCGKTTIARICATKLGCHPRDLKEINAADDRGIEMVREIKSSIGLTPLGGPCRVWIIDEAHQLTPQAQESFLKTLEDTPPHVFFMICTSEPAKLKASMITRSTEIKVRSLKASECKTLLDNVAAKEGKKFTEDVCSKIFSISEGSPRKALVLLNQILSIAEEEDQLHALDKADTKRDAFELCRLLLNTGSTWKEYCEVLKSIESTEIESCRWMVLGYMNRIALSNGKGTPRAISVIESFMEPFYDSKAAGLTQACYFCFSAGK